MERFYITIGRNIYYFIKWLTGRGILINGWIEPKGCCKIKHRNLGDDLNFYLIKELTRKTVIPYWHCWWARKGHLKNYMVIGTLLGTKKHYNDAVVVWGSGFSGEQQHRFFPKKYRAVRGYKTGEILRKNGFSTELAYGDPVLLLPLVYKPHSKKKYEWGIILHVDEPENDFVSTLLNDNPEIHRIMLSGYSDWRNVIDEICACKRIISSSLHGLIISDAYKIPNCWVTVSGVLSHVHFKFLDYFSSVGRSEEEPYKFNDMDDFNLLKEKIKTWHSPQIDILPLLKACPFELKKEYKVW